MKALLIGLLALGSISAFADESIGSKEVIFNTTTGYNTGTIQAESENGYIVYFRSKINDAWRSKLVPKDQVGFRVLCHDSICEGDLVSSPNGRRSAKVKAVFTDGSILAGGYDNTTVRYNTQTAIRH
jgi:hypothetical protein